MTTPTPNPVAMISDDAVREMAAQLRRFPYDDYKHSVAHAADMLEKLLAERERFSWQPIETAPSFGAHFLAFTGKYQYVMCSGAWGPRLIHMPATILPPYPATHWMPLPAPPTTPRTR